MEGYNHLLRALSTWHPTMVRIWSNTFRSKREGQRSATTRCNWDQVVSSAMLILACQACLACHISFGQASKNRPSAPAENSHLCDRLAGIKHIPYDAETVDDPIYNQIISNKHAAVSCLVDQITNEKRMADPRSEPVESNFRVGDLAFFLLLDITKILFDQMLPDNVQAQLKKEGVYAYFKYVSVPGNRAVLQRQCKAWLARRRSVVLLSGRPEPAR
jgi:hypothetical protein